MKVTIIDRQKRNLKNITFGALFSVMLSSPMLAVNVTAAEVETSKKVLIDQLLEQTGQSAIAVANQFSNIFTQQMSGVLKQSQPNIDPRAFTIIEEEINALITEEIVAKGELLKMMYPIYAEHFSADELQQMITLNNTPLGKKLISVMPQIAQQGMQAGQVLGQSLGPKIQQRILVRFQAEGIK